MSENKSGISIKIGKTVFTLDWDARQWIYKFGQTSPKYLTSMESVYHHLSEDLVKYKKSPLDVEELKATLALGRKNMEKVLKEVGKALDEKRAKLTT